LKVKRIKWLDTGNLDDLSKTKEYFKDTPLSLQKETNEITYKENNIFIKFVPKLELLKNRIFRAEILGKMIPKNFGNTNNFMFYKWVDGKTLYEWDDLNLCVKFLDTFKENLKTITDTNKDSIKSFYVDKTIDRINLFVKKYGEDYINSEHEINGVIYQPMRDLFNKFNFEILDNNPFYTLFHGDLQFDNIIYNNSDDEYLYIDWRDSFGKSTNSGDVYYDLAKLYGGLMIPYNLMKLDDKIMFNEGLYSVKYSYEIPTTLVKFKSIYEKWIISNGFDLNKVKKITALIYLNMSPLHDGKFGKMLWFKSIEMLNEYDK